MGGLEKVESKLHLKMYILRVEITSYSNKPQFLPHANCSVIDGDE